MADQEEKPIYKSFDDDKDEMLKLMENGLTATKLCIGLMKKYRVSTRVKFLISALGLLPENQTTEQWLANYEHYEVNKTFNKSYRG